MVSILLTFSIAQVESFNGGSGISWAHSNHFSPGVMRSKKTLIFERSVRMRMKARGAVGDPFASANLLRRRCSSQGSVTGNAIENKMRTRSLVLFSSVVRSSHGIFESDDDSASSTLENGASDSERNETAADFQSGGASISLKEDEEFKAAVKDVKDAAKNVTSSAIGLTTTIASKGPGILVRLLFAIVSVELRLVHIVICAFLHLVGVHQRLYCFSSEGMISNEERDNMYLTGQTLSEQNDDVYQRFFFFIFLALHLL
jgi:hypothetical protein